MREIPDPGFAADDGTADPALQGALAAARDDPDRAAEALHALCSARLLVPVTAVAGTQTSTQTSTETGSDMAVVQMRGRDGRLALLAFTGQEPMRSWDAAARPVPVTARTAARAAVQDGADAMLVDVAGPAAYVVSGEDLRALAAGWSPARVGDRTAWIRPPSE